MVPHAVDAHPPNRRARNTPGRRRLLGRRRAGQSGGCRLAGFDSLVADAQLYDVAEIDAEKAYTTTLINFVGTCDSVDVRSVLSAMSVMWRHVIADYQVTPADHQITPADHQIAPPDHQVRHTNPKNE